MGDRLGIYSSHQGQLSPAIPPWVGAMSTGDGYGCTAREENRAGTD